MKRLPLYTYLVDLAPNVYSGKRILFANTNRHMPITRNPSGMLEAFQELYRVLELLLAIKPPHHYIEYRCQTLFSRQYEACNVDLQSHLIAKKQIEDRGCQAKLSLVRGHI